MNGTKLLIVHWEWAGNQTHEGPFLGRSQH